MSWDYRSVGNKQKHESHGAGGGGVEFRVEKMQGFFFINVS